MIENEIIKLISELSNDNPLKANMNYEYTKEFIRILSNIDSVSYKKIKNLVCGNSKYSDSIFYQGVSELLLYFLLQQKGIPFFTDQKENSENKKDIDIVFEFKGIKYNVEVKSPEYTENRDSNIHGSFDCRFGDKDENKKIIDNLIFQMSPHLKGSRFSNVTYDELTDNKVKSFLLSAHDKFITPSQIMCNILFISTTTKEMINYWNYIVNEHSGFFNTVSDISLFTRNKKDKTPLSRESYNKVTAIVLSNAITLNKKRTTSSWDISNAINIVLTNPNCTCVSIKGLQILSEFFPHKTCEFANGLSIYKNKHPDIPEICYAHEFVDNYGYGLNEETKG